MSSNTNTFSGAPAGWNTLPPIRTSPVGVENVSQAATPSRQQLPSIPHRMLMEAQSPMIETRRSPFRFSGTAPPRLTRAPAPPKPLLARRPQPLSNSVQRPARVPHPANAMQGQRVPLPNAGIPNRKLQKHNSRSQAKTSARVMAISDLLNPVIDREMEMGAAVLAELALVCPLSSSSEEGHLLPQASSSGTRAETPDVEMWMDESADADAEGSVSSSSEERDLSPSTSSSSGMAAMSQDDSSELSPVPSSDSSSEDKDEVAQTPASSTPTKTRKSGAAGGLEACRICKLKFASQEILTWHVEASHPDAVKCPTCKRGFQSKSGLGVHQGRSEACKLFQCETCEEKFATANLLCKHAARHTKDVSQKTGRDELADSSPLQAAREGSGGKMEKQKKVRCPGCKRYFRRQHTLEMHQQSPNACRSFKCGSCTERGFTNQVLLDAHVAHAHKAMFCMECGDKFADSRQMQAHITAVHKDSLICMGCGVLFTIKQSLVYHQRSPTACKGFKPNTLPEKLISQGLQDDHESDTDTESPSSCLLCGETFVAKLALMKHRLSPRACRPFKCSTCKEKFSSQVELENHLFVHQKPFPIKCMRCTGTFAGAAELWSHVCYAPEWTRSSPKASDAATSSAVPAATSEDEESDEEYADKNKEAQLRLSTGEERNG